VIVLYGTLLPVMVLLTPILGLEILITRLSIQSCQRTVTMSPPIGKKFSPFCCLSTYVLNAHIT
jgi:hypothetical protein